MSQGGFAATAREKGPHNERKLLATALLSDSRNRRAAETVDHDHDGHQLWIGSAGIDISNHVAIEISNSRGKDCSRTRSLLSTY